MAERDSETQAVVFEETLMLSVEEVCRACELSSEELGAMIEEGLVQPREARNEQRLFAATTIVRIRTAQRLQRDLGLNLAGAALALELLDELHAARARLRALERLLGE